MRRFETLLAERLGLAVASIGREVVHRGVAARMVALGALDTDAYWRTLQRDEAEVQELIEHVVVPETWFLRNPEAFAAFREIALTKLATATANVPLHVLSVPCSTGEEAYSLAITLLEAGFSREQVQLDAIDVSQRALERARDAVYGQNSFRGHAEHVRDTYCEPLAHNRFALDPAIRAWVAFETGNLSTSSFAPRASRYDVIFCRNVLIYLQPEVQATVFHRLRALLADDGYLFLGPAEVPLAVAHGFAATAHDMAFACRKDTAGDVLRPMRAGRRRTPALPAARVSLPARPQPANPMERLRALLAGQAAVPPNSPTTTAAPARAGSDRAATLARAQALADAGQLEEAAALCREMLHDEGCDVTALYLLGVTLDEMGDGVGAETCYRKVLFLDPNHADASLHLAIHAARHGDVARAQQLRERAQRIERRRQA